MTAQEPFYLPLILIASTTQEKPQNHSKLQISNFTTLAWSYLHIQYQQRMNYQSFVCIH